MGNVDDKNNPITSLSSSSSKTKQKKKKRVAGEDKEGAQRRASLRMNSEGLLESRAKSELGMLQQLIMTHGDCAARYNENVAIITNEILPDMNNLLSTITADVANIAAYGDSVMLELEAAELKVQQAWDVYSAAAGAALAGGGGGGEEEKEKGSAEVRELG